MLYNLTLALPDRATFLTCLSSALTTDPANVKYRSVLWSEIDDFSALQETLGDSVAQSLASAAAGRIQHALSSEDLLAQLSDCEFAVLFANTDRADPTCDKIRAAFQLPFQVRSNTILVSLKLGVARASDDTDSPDRLLKAAQAVAIQTDFNERSITKSEGPESLSQQPGITDGIWLPGYIVGRFQITAMLGRGGMGEVYSAYDTLSKREVAIKVLAKQATNDPIALNRFHNEFRALAALSHPNILELYGVDTLAGRCFAYMELLKGETLKNKIKSGPLSLETSLNYAMQIAEGLAAAHRKGIVHRDLKPDNIFVTDDQHIKILDFGLARFANADEDPVIADKAGVLSSRTQPGVVLGTIGYMSPEQARGELADARSDVFSFGVVFYEMLCNKSAFPGSTIFEVLNALLQGEPSLQQCLPIPSDLEMVLKKCLHKDPKERFASAHDVAAELKKTVRKGRVA